MKRREEWRPVLDAEVKRWETKSCEQLFSELKEEQAYEIVLAGKKYQVEVTMLENTDNYLHILVSIDDGSIPASFRPISTSFIREKPTSREGQRPTTGDQRQVL